MYCALLRSLCLLGWLVLTSTAGAGANEALDLVLAGGRVLDPESGLDAVRFVGIREGRIAALSEAPLEGAETLDVSGHVVAPGFVDLHIHGQEPTSYDFLARDGVTSALELEAGVHDVASFLARREGIARIHYGASAGHIPARAYVVDDVAVEHLLTAETMESGPTLWWMGLRLWLGYTLRFSYAPLDTPQRASVLQALEAELDAGAIGIGMGLAYTPGADEAEVGSIFGLAARRGVPCFVHLPRQENPRDVAPLESVLAHARISGAALHVVHVNSSSREAIDAYLARIDSARQQGVDVSVEAYPYTAGSTLIEAAIFDPGWRERAELDYGDLQWAATGERLTRESFERHRAQGGTVIIHNNTEERVAKAIAHPLVMVASDGMPMHEYKPHPRGAGTRARVLARYVRERGDFDLMTALRKLSLDPARRLEAIVPAMRRKGRIRVGADADLVVFDPDRVRDRATFEEPHQASDGIPHVLVAGKLVVRDGKLVDHALPGQPLRAEP